MKDETSLMQSNETTARAGDSEPRAGSPRRKLRGIHGTLPDDLPAMTGARIFVTLVFTLIGISFVAWTALFINEFRDHEWQSLLLLHSHLFLFFPTFGVLALVAFHLPSTVFTHMYWNHVPHGRLRFIIGTLIVIALTAVFSLNLLTTGPRQIWEISPNVLARDKADPDGCNPSRQTCRRVGLLDGVTSLRTAAQGRFGVSQFARTCRQDPLLEVPQEFTRERFCFASGGKLAGEACCTAQASYASHLDEVWAEPKNRSLTDAADIVAIPLKTFFVIVVVVIGVLLVAWRRLLEAQYASIAPVIERTMLIGALAMLPWPFMDYAFVQGMQTLSGRWTVGPQFRLSLIIAPWALLLLIFFLGRMSRKIERLGQLAGAVVSLIALLRYEQMSDAAVMLLGVGAPGWLPAALLALSIACLMALRWPEPLQRALNAIFGRQPDDKTPTPPAAPAR